MVRMTERNREDEVEGEGCICRSVETHHTPTLLYGLFLRALRKTCASCDWAEVESCRWRSMEPTLLWRSGSSGPGCFWRSSTSDPLLLIRWHHSLMSSFLFIYLGKQAFKSNNDLNLLLYHSVTYKSKSSLILCWQLRNIIKLKHWMKRRVHGKFVQVTGLKHLKAWFPTHTSVLGTVITKRSDGTQYSISYTKYCTALQTRHYILKCVNVMNDIIITY